MKAYKRMSKGTWALLIASAIATSGAMIDTQVYAQEKFISSAFISQVKDQSNREVNGGQVQTTGNNSDANKNTSGDSAT